MDRPEPGCSSPFPPGAAARSVRTPPFTRPVDPESTATFLWAAWDGVIACHLGPANMNLSDSEFEAVLDRAREVLALGLLAPDTPSDGGKG